MIKLQKNSLYIVVASSLLLLFCLVYQGTYSYFAVGVTDKREDQNMNSHKYSPVLYDIGENIH